MVDFGNKGERYRQALLLTTIPMVLVAGPLVGFYIGKYLDEWMGTSPWMMIVFLILGGAAAVEQTIRLLARAGQEEKKNGR
ncbi:MAG TPA: AtpZ/AtpI family protein [Nitrospiria bacterium]|nr:AtpZ/AtpI family protein [Nitrospiria bacterium]